MTNIDTDRIRSTWESARKLSDQIARDFYATLFVLDPDTQTMFPVDMGEQRRKIMEAIGDVVASVEDIAEVVPMLRQLGVDHRRFGVEAVHYETVGKALLITLEQALGETEWDTATAVSWMNAYQLVADTMSGAAQEAADAGVPPWWDSVISDVEPLDPDTTALTLKPELPYPDSSPVVRMWAAPHAQPGSWIMLRAEPLGTGELRVVVKAEDGDPVSTGLVVAATVGELVRLGAPLGFTVPAQEEP